MALSTLALLLVTTSMLLAYGFRDMKLLSSSSSRALRHGISTAASFSPSRYGNSCFIRRLLSSTGDGTSRTRLQSTPGGGGRASAAVSQDREKASGGDVKANKKQALDLNPPKGTRDFYPEDQRFRNWLFGKWKSIAAGYGFEEYDAPVLESEELYIRKAGEEVTQQLYNFEDKGGRRLSLRPEMTPSLARMVLARRGGLPLPLKWFSIPQCWRYERMTRGRRREHYQWNMDIWGVKGVEAEVELLSAIVASFKDLGITAEDVGLKVNSRKLVTALMTSLGIEKAKWASTCVLIDKLEKVPLDSLTNDLEALGLTKEVVEKLVATMQIKTLDGFKRILPADSEGVADLERLFYLAEGYGLRDWLLFDATVIRGLAYYTGVVFEGFDRKGELRAICGGGRYDSLIESMGGEALPAVGFGFGDAVIYELLLAKDLLPDTSRPTIDVLVYAMDEKLRNKAAMVSSQLRAEGLNVDFLLEDKKAKWVFQRADKIGAPVVLMFAEKESSEGKVVVKSLRESSQVTVDDVDVVEAVKKMLSK